ncbi:hypothetical protein DENSPDRAFT_887052 [Dentipellis sp. KUC8613]|nr:hypothetical protein DENSPDRAFT_887052 [Dentipellis sp. KUC8613]
MPHVAIFGPCWVVCNPHHHLHALPRPLNAPPHHPCPTTHSSCTRPLAARGAASYALVSSWALAPPPHVLTSMSRAPKRSSHAPAVSFQGRDPMTPPHPPTMLPRAPAPMSRAPATPPGAPASLSRPPASPA